MSIESLGYLGFRVKDPEALGTFASNVLGMMPAEQPGRFRIDDHAWRFALEAG